MSTLVVNAIENDSGEARFNPTAATPQATTSGTEFDFTDIPSWVTRITLLMNAVSLSGTDALLVQLGDAGGFETTGYVGESLSVSNAAVGADTSTSGLPLRMAGTTDGSGTVTLIKVEGNEWVSSHAFRFSTSIACFGGGRKELSGTLTQVRLTPAGSDTFDAGSVNIIYE